jgi:hypothetical protein
MPRVGFKLAIPTFGGGGGAECFNTLVGAATVIGKMSKCALFICSDLS